MTAVPGDGRAVTLTVPDPDLLDAVVAPGLPDGARVVLWDMTAPFAGTDDVAPEDVDLVLPPLFVGPRHLALLDSVPRAWVLQLASAGVEHALPYVPDHVTVCNGRGVHDAGTAELALGLTLASLRGIDDAVREAQHGRWTRVVRPSLAERRVMVLGHGSIGAAVARRLHAFEAEVVPVASRARDEGGVHVHGVDELPALLPTVDVVIVVLPLTQTTERLVDAAFLAAMPDGALIVNVGRGRVVDTDALLAEVTAGRLKAALDVTDPEPLPQDHPLWHAPGVIITPHVGGSSDATVPRLADLLRRQAARLGAGSEPLNVVRAGAQVRASV